VPRPRVQLVYPAGPQIGCPQAIGRHLAESLGRRYDVTLHAWDSLGALKPDPGAALIGHPHPNPLTRFRRSAAKSGWGRVLMMCPYNGDAGQVAWLDPVLQQCDAWLAITGPYWFKRVAGSPFRRWKPRMRQLDLAVDRGEFPRLKGRFAPRGKRRFLFVGHSGWPKNTGYLSQIAMALPGFEFAWAGSGTEAIAGVTPLGRLDFSGSAAQSLVAGFDFMITVGTADANPATLLEAMAWGLIPVCSPQSGYEKMPGITNVPLNDLEGAVKVLKSLQQAAPGRLEALRRANDASLDRHYHWGRFAADVEKAIEAKGRPALQEDPESRAWMRAEASKSPLRAWSPRLLKEMLKSQIRSIVRP
jgi:hypothetical protein